MQQTTVFWHDESDILTVASKRSLGSVCDRIRDRKPDWIVVRRSRDATNRFTPYFYAFQPDELLALEEERPEWRARPVEEALDLHEHGQSTTAAGLQPHRIDRMGDSGPASWRVVHLGFDAEPISVGRIDRPMQEQAGAAPPDGHEEAAAPPPAAEEAAAPPPAEAAAPAPEERVDAPREEAAAPPDRDDEHPSDGEAAGEGAGEQIDLGPSRGRSSRPERRSRSRDAARRVSRGTPRMQETGPAEEEKAAPEEETQTVTISADAERRVPAGTSTYIVYQIERAGEAAPFQERFDTEISTAEGIDVLLSIDSKGIEVMGERIQRVAPPGAGSPTHGSFEIRALDLPAAQGPSIARLALIFRQGSTDLGRIAFSILIVGSGDDAGRERAHASVEAAPRDRQDDEMLVLLIEQESDGDGTCYEYRLHGEALDLNYLTLRSAPLLDRGGGAAATTLAYVEAIYERVTQDVLSRSDANRLTRQLRALGATMCGELFDPEVTRKLWPLRDRIKTVQVVSWEPYIPWELLRLRNPDTDELDDRFLCEYGLIRSMPGTAAPRRLQLDSWHFLAAQYEHGLEPSVGGEVDYFTDSLPARGIQPVAIPSSYDEFFDALNAGDFDVLHIACHGESEHAQIENSVLIIGDEAGPGGEPRPLEVDAVTVRQEARLRQRQPLIFLNACESGRHGPNLTSWGGWPTAFLEAGAGAFVGTSWPVREKPARIFAHTFYDALLNGETLSAATTSARLATKDLGDASWLAFKVYGHPHAKLNGAASR